MTILNRFKSASPKETTAEQFTKGLGLVGVCILFTLGGYLLYIVEARYLNGLIAADRALIVYREYLAGAFFAPLAGGSITTIVIIHFLHRDLFKKPLSRFFQLLQRVLLGGMLLGLALMVAGGYFVHSKWEPRFKAAGYTQCENVVVRFDKSFTHSAWMKRPQDCTNDEVHQILHDQHGRRGFDRASKYLERQHRLEGRKS